MKPDFDYGTVPYNFLHCLNGQCPHANECLRYQVAQRVPASCETFTTVAPTYAAANGHNCQFFKPEQLQTFAIGITHLLDNVPHSHAISLQKQIFNYFKRNTYYRIKNKERLIKPEEQEHIRRLFLQKGVTAIPVYDEYLEQYEW